MTRVEIRDRLIQIADDIRADITSNGRSDSAVAALGATEALIAELADEPGLYDGPTCDHGTPLGVFCDHCTFGDDTESPEAVTEC